jgi:hypothetical protein
MPRGVAPSLPISGPLGGPASPPASSSMPTPAPGSPRAGVTTERLKSPGAVAAHAGAEAAAAAVASVSAALSGMFSQQAPSSASISATGVASPRLPRAPKDSRSAPKDVYVAPTPAVMVSGDVQIPSGPAVVHGQSFVQVRQGQMAHGNANAAASSSGSASASSAGEGGEYMYSLAASGDQLAELNEARVLAETKVRELEKQVKKLSVKSGVLEADLEGAYKELDGKDSELRRLRQLERAANKRPELMAALRGNLSAALIGASPSASATSASASSGLPFSSSADRGYVFELARRLPFLQPFPETVVWEVLHHATIHSLPADAPLSSCPGATDSILLLVEGTVAHTGAGVAPGSVVIGPGDYLCEHTLMNRPPRAGRDASLWSARSDTVVVVALPSPLLRRLILSESALLDAWNEGSLSTMISHTYSPLRPAPRMSLHADAAFGSAVSHATLHKAVLHVATGGHVLEALAAERLAAERKAGKSGNGGGSGGMSLAGEDEEEDEDAAVLGEGAAERAVASIPAHLAQNAPLLIHVLQAMGGGGNAVAPLERTLHTLVHAVERFFGASGAALFEIDDTARVMHQLAVAQHAKSAAGGAGSNARTARRRRPTCPRPFLCRASSRPQRRRR